MLSAVADAGRRQEFMGQYTSFLFYEQVILVAVYLQPRSYL